MLKGLAKKWPEMVVKWTIVTTRLGETVFKYEVFTSVVASEFLVVRIKFFNDPKIIPNYIDSTKINFKPSLSHENWS